VLQKYRENDRQIRLQTGKDASTSEAIIVADEDTPYRLLFEVLYTAGQCEFGKYHLLMRTGKK
jgi:biopolymer transport protein ExbD